MPNRVVPGGMGGGALRLAVSVVAAEGVDAGSFEETCTGADDFSLGF
jgi:hypothetical protein